MSRWQSPTELDALLPEVRGSLALGYGPEEPPPPTDDDGPVIRRQPSLRLAAPVLLRSLPRAEGALYVLPDCPIALERHPVIVFGDGGSAKSYLGLWLAGRMVEAGRRVLFVDYEFAGEDHRDRLERLFGDDMPDVLYLRAERPLVRDADRLAGIVRGHGIGYLVIDSVAFACDGPPEAAEVAGRYFGAVRRFGVGSLHLAHVRQGEDGDRKPFGSTFWHNGARATWFMKRSAEPSPGEVIVGLYPRKSNIGPLADPFGLALSFDADRTSVRTTSIGDVRDLASRLPLWQRVRDLVRSGAMTYHELATDLEEPVDSVSKAVRRYEGKLFTKVAGHDGIYRIGLLERQRDEP
jgi:hypothetical protein